MTAPLVRLTPKSSNRGDLLLQRQKERGQFVGGGEIFPGEFGPEVVRYCGICRMLIQSDVPVAVQNIGKKWGETGLDDSPSPMGMFMPPLRRQDFEPADFAEDGGREGQKYAVEEVRRDDGMAVNFTNLPRRFSDRIVLPRPGKMVNSGGGMRGEIGVQPAGREPDVVFGQKTEGDAG